MGRRLAPHDADGMLHVYDTSWSVSKEMCYLASFSWLTGYKWYDVNEDIHLLSHSLTTVALQPGLHMTRNGMKLSTTSLCKALDTRAKCYLVLCGLLFIVLDEKVGIEMI